VPKSHKDHGGVAKAVAITPSGPDQPVDLGLGQIREGGIARISEAIRLFRRPDLTGHDDIFGKIDDEIEH
jgi:hypothetical protein